MTGHLPDPRSKPWLTVAELAEITGEGEKVIRAALDAGQLPVLQIGRYKRIPTAALLQALSITDSADATTAEPDHPEQQNSGPASPLPTTPPSPEVRPHHGRTPPPPSNVIRIDGR